MYKKYRIALDPKLNTYAIGTDINESSKSNVLNGNRFHGLKIYKMVNDDSVLNNIETGLHSRKYYVLTFSDEKKIIQFGNANVESVKITDDRFVILVNAEYAKRTLVAIEY